MTKIQMKTPLAEIDGDEMTRVIWRWIKDELILPYVDLKTEYYDLELTNRDATSDKITLDAVEATGRLGVAVKCATITPTAAQVTEHKLKQQWKSPNAAIRGALDGTVFRAPIPLECVTPAVPRWKKPITIARHAYGDIYKNIEQRAGGVVIQTLHNTEKSIKAFAESCFKYAEDTCQPLWFSCKDTISPIYDGAFREIFAETAHDYPNVDYFYTLIDDAVSRVIRSEGGFIWALKNYDGDVMSDMLSSAFGSLSMMTSVLVSPDGKYEYEAAHGTVTRHYYRYLDGETPGTNPVATIFAWIGALRKRAELDELPELLDFTAGLEAATLDTLNGGIMTGDLAALASSKVRAVNTLEFLAAVKARI
ncbi:MAG: NADP-dependent isocitrate dehydrogenase [Oscillospiraceae bacterium]|jgi:isocitrate dehydrogenase|nr:NADP-dependent isocitrate dehydrogenase [Oscillospiraceae bacterium]